MKRPHNNIAERVIIAGILSNGIEAFEIVNEHLSHQDFFIHENSIIYNAVESLFTENITNLTPATILTKIKNTQPSLIKKYNLDNYIDILVQDALPKDNLKPYAIEVAKYSYVRKLQDALIDNLDKLEDFKPDTKISSAMSQIEQSLQEITQKLLKNSVNQTIRITDLVGDFLNKLADEKPTHLGLSIGFPKWERYIGGGLRRGVHLCGGRAKSGKSQIAIQAAINTAIEQNIPTLYLDSELDTETVMIRMTSNLSEIEQNRIESGLFTESQQESAAIQKAIEVTREKPYYYHNISSQNHYEWISAIRRWLIKNVGFNENGKANPCLVILDYIKTMNMSDLGAMTEWQYLGQIMTDLHNFCLEYDIPILAFVQLNREGINNDHQGVIAGSDRIIALCTSFTILRQKAGEDYADDPQENGNRKLFVVACRHGPAMDSGEYLNLVTDFAKSKIIEGNTNLQNRQNENFASNTQALPTKRKPKTTKSAAQPEVQDTTVIHF